MELRLGELLFAWPSPYVRVPLVAGPRLVLRPPGRFVPPSNDRPRDLSCRMGLAYPRASVAWQRRAVRERLSHRLATAKLSRREYFRELETSKVVLSPFGFGEITLKDFEVFLAGGLLMKPDLSHVETWPALFRDGETMVAHDWDLSDLEEKIDRVLAGYPRFVEVARHAQELYRRHLVGEEAATLFCDRFLNIVTLA